MPSIQEDVDHLRGQLRVGAVQRAYRALLGYMMALRTHLQRTYPDYTMSGLYQGLMDMTYFAIVPPSLKRRGLKIAIVFDYEAFRFEAWLAGANRQVQRKYWMVFRDSRCTAYHVVTPAKGVDAIVECTLAEDFNLDDLDGLTTRIEERAAAFIGDVERFLADREGASGG